MVFIPSCSELQTSEHETALLKRLLQGLRGACRPVRNIIPSQLRAAIAFSSVETVATFSHFESKF
ncbi:hypothetical protein [Nostoc sp. ATCC 53789]|uniref:hypothetical protein n=1 Tax=Nostoc sp. ATCC 53789 TaxID=76335 RepID=UPI0011BE55A9|nr:hypothetical protein [Nostoc sp. ATCC 53789]MBD2510318.1 hypothetical protein [Desmonostoc muscorum FACHB-395]QHG17195.1 hypothetical protein GJB62_15250 [Nostoc sp. ATCC 53789]